MLEVKETKSGGFGEFLGIEAGDKILAFDGHEVRDILDYMYYDARPKFTVLMQKKDGSKAFFKVRMAFDESLGLAFKDDGLEIMTCRNKCVFCFVDQMPKGLRESLYLKDDDYRQSFLHGNYITLTNLSDKDIERIIRLKLSPIYVSVHAMRKDLREKIMNNRFAGKIGEQLKKLVRGGIDIHAQIVLVKGLNDGSELRYTLDKLYRYRRVKSVAVVPCGITGFREGLYPISDITKEYAAEVISLIDAVNKKHGKEKAKPADEFYFRAGKDLPDYSSYGDFCQVENGVGMSVKFRKDVEEIVNGSLNPVLKPGRYLTFSGTSAFKYISEIADFVAKSCRDVEIKVAEVKNNFFGPTVNCTGLLTGSDIFSALSDIAKDYDVLLVPDPCLKCGEDRFLDGWTLETLSEKLGIKAVRAALKN